jgi:hypothetical protein
MCLTIFLFEKIVCKKLTTPLIRVFDTLKKEEITISGQKT